MKKIKIFSMILISIFLVFLIIIKFSEKPEDILQKHLKNKYKEEFVIAMLGKREEIYEAIIYPKKYEGTPRENDSYYWGKGFVRGKKGADTYGLVLLNESTNEFYLPKLKELFGNNVLPIFNLGPAYTKNNFKEEIEIMKKSYKSDPTGNFEPISGGIYIFGRVESDEDREWYRKQIYEFVQFMKKTGTFEYVDLGVVIWDERVLSEEFRTNEDLRKAILVARNIMDDDKEFINERKRLMKKTDESMKKLTKEEKDKILNNYIKSDIYGVGNRNDEIFVYNKLLGMRIYSPKYIEMKGWNKSKDPNVYEEIKNYDNVSDIKFTFEQY